MARISTLRPSARGMTPRRRAGQRPQQGSDGGRFMSPSTRGRLSHLAAIVALTAAAALAHAIVAPIIARGIEIESPREAPASPAMLRAASAGDLSAGRPKLSADRPKPASMSRPSTAPAALIDAPCRCCADPPTADCCPVDQCPCAIRAATLERDRAARRRQFNWLALASLIPIALALVSLYFANRSRRFAADALRHAANARRLGLILLLGASIAAGAATAQADLPACIDATCRLSHPSASGGRDVGTGCVIRADADRVLVLTAAHVTGPAGTAITAEFWHRGYQSRPLPARVVWTSYLDVATAFRDVALVELAAAEFRDPSTGRLYLPPAIPLGRPEASPAAGQTIVTVGCPSAEWPSAVVGHILRNSGQNGRGAVADFVPTPAGGRSGSAIFDAGGTHVIGLLAWAAKDSPADPEPTHGRFQTIAEVWAALQGAKPLAATDLEAADRAATGQPLGSHTAATPAQCPGGNCWRPYRRDPPANQSPSPSPGNGSLAPYPGLPDLAGPGSNPPAAVEYATRDALDQLAGRVSDLEHLRADVTDQAAATADAAALASAAQADAQAAKLQADAAAAAAASASNAAATAQIDATHVEEKTESRLAVLAHDLRAKIDDQKAAGETDTKAAILSAARDLALDRAPSAAAAAAQALGLTTLPSAALVAAAMLLRRRVRRRIANRAAPEVAAAPASFRTAGPFSPRV